jgi:hypothetical protein
LRGWAVIREVLSPHPEKHEKLRGLNRVAIVKTATHVDRMSVGRLVQKSFLNAKLA